MPNFKPKTNKKIKINKRKQITLDSKHNEMMKKFSNIENIKIPNLNDKIMEIENKIKNENSLETKLELEDELKTLIIKKKKISKEKKKYLLDNSKFIFDYFEKKRDISKGNSKKKILH